MTISRGLVVLALFAGGCGGKVVFDPGSGGASSTTAVTVGASSTKAATTGAGGGCPVEAPVAGAACSQQGLTCPLPNECCQPTAKCDGGHWSISNPGCGSICIPCGPSLECAASAVCVATSVVNTVDYRCEANPCSGKPLDCACAAGLCSQVQATCVGASGSQVTCETGTKG